MKSERQTHLDWCKERALYYIDNGLPAQAIASFISDMNKSEHTRNHIALELAPKMMLRSKEDIKEYITGFN